MKKVCAFIGGLSAGVVLLAVSFVVTGFVMHHLSSTPITTPAAIIMGIWV